MLRGNAETKIDEKGRLKVPADFKKVFELECPESKFYITSVDGKTARIYPMDEWRRIEEKLAKLGSFNAAKKKFLNKVNYYGQTVEMDGQGRLLLPQTLREAAGLMGDVSVYGNLTYLEVRNADVAKSLAEEKLTADDEKTLDDLGI